MSEFEGRLNPDLLNFDQATVLPNDASGLSPDERIRFRWEIHEGLLKEAEDWAYANRKSFSDEVARFKRLVGPYRSISIETGKDREGSYLIQEFAKGWVTSLVTESALDYTEARLVQKRDLPPSKVAGTPVAPDLWGNPEHYLLMRWEGIDPTAVDAIAASINALAEDTFEPVINGETIGTGFTRLYCRGFREWDDEDDRAGRIDLLVAKPRWNLQLWAGYGTKAQTGRYELYNVPKYVAQELINSYNKQTGASCNAGDESDEGLINLSFNVPSTNDTAEVVITYRSCTRIVTSSYYINQSAAVATPTDEASGVWYDANWRQDYGTGLWSGVIEKHEAIQVTVSSHVVEATYASDTSKQEWLNLRGTPGSYTDHNGSPVSLPGMTDELGKRKQLTTRKQSNCTTDAEYREETAQDQAGSAYSDSGAESIVVATATQSTEITSATAAAGTIVKVRSNPTLFGQYSTSQETITAKNQTATEWIKSHSQVSQIARQTQGTEATEPTLIDGVQYRIRQRPTPFGKTAIEYETVTATDQPLTDWEKTAARSVSRSKHTQGSDLTEPTRSAGTIVRWTQRPTEFGKVDSVEETVTAVDQEGQDSEDSAARSVSTVTHTQSVAVGVASAIAGTIVRKQDVPTEYGQNATRVTTITPKDQSAFEYEVAASRSVTRTTHTEGSTLAGPAALTGHIYRHINRPTEVGNMATVLEDDAATDQAGTEYERSAARSLVILTNTHTSSLTAPSLSAGSVLRRVSVPTAYGDFQTRAAVDTAIDQEATSYEDRHDQGSARALSTQEPSALPSPTASAGTIRRSGNIPTEYGRYRTEDETITAKDQTGEQYEDNHAESIVVNIHTQGTALTSPTAGIGTVLRRSNTPTTFGLDETRDEVRTAKDQTGEEYREDHAESVRTDTHTQGSALSIPAAVVGQRIRRINRPTEFGLDATVSETTTTKDQTSEDSEDTHAQSSVITEHTQGSAVGTASAASGTIARSTNAPTPFGLYNTRQEIITAKDQPSTDSEDNAARTTVVSEHTQGTELGTASAAAGTIVRNSNVPTAFGLFQTRNEVVTVHDQTSTDREDTHSHSSITTEHTQGGALSSLSAVAGQILTGTETPTEYGKYSTRSTVVTAKDQESTDRATTHAMTEVVSEHTQGDAITPVVPSVGQTWIGTENPTQFGKYGTRSILRTAIDQTGGRAADRHDRSSSAITHTQGSALVAPSAGSGTIVERVWEPTEFGTYESRDNTITAKDQTGGIGTDDFAQSSTVDTHTQGAALTAPTAAAGTRVVRRWRPTEFGLHTTEDETITAKDQTSTDLEESHAETVTRGKHTQGTEVTTISAAAGEIKRVVNTPTNFGLFGTVEETRTAVDQEGSLFSDSAAEEVTQEVHTQAITALTPPSAVTGSIEYRRSTPTAYGRYNTITQTVTPKNQDGAQVVVDAHKKVEVTRNSETTALTLPVTYTPGVQITADNRPTRAGNNRTDYTIITPVPQRKETSYSSVYGTAYLVWAINQPLGSCDVELATYSASAWTVSPGSCVINHFNLEDYSYRRVPKASGVDVIPVDFDDARVLQQWEHDTSSDKWYSRTLYCLTAWRYKETAIARSNAIQDLEQGTYGVTIDSGTRTFGAPHRVGSVKETMGRLLTGDVFYQAVAQYRKVQMGWGEDTYSAGGDDTE
jgi:hypothetical protein